MGRHSKAHKRPVQKHEALRHLTLTWHEDDVVVCHALAASRRFEYRSRGEPIRPVLLGLLLVPGVQGEVHATKKTAAP